jgi:hypothetical protein
VLICFLIVRISTSAAIPIPAPPTPPSSGRISLGFLYRAVRTRRYELATTGELGAARALHTAIASLLRMANADLADARLVLREGQARNAAVIAGRAVANLIRALAASEHEWPPVSGHDVIDAITSVNPLQHGLLTTEALLADAADQHVGSDGRIEAAPDHADISDVLGDVEAILNTASQAFGVAVSGETPAANANPIRPPGPADDAEDPDEPADGAAEEADEPVEVGEETAPQKAPSAQDDKAPAPAKVVRARKPKQRIAASRQGAELASSEPRLRTPVIVHGNHPGGRANAAERCRLRSGAP